MKEKINIYIKYVEILLATVVICVGIFLRWKVWQADLSFWVDEDALIFNAMDIITGKYPVWRGLASECSPPLFFALTKPIYAIFGLNEVAFRFIPFLASIVSLPAFAFLAKKILKTPFLFLIPLLLVSVNENLLFCSQYYKFYSSDFLFAILVSIAVFSLSFEKMSYKQSALWGIIAGIACWSSYSAVFYLAGIFCFLLIKILFNFSKEKCFKYLFLTVPSVIMLSLYLIENYTRRMNVEYLQSYWLGVGGGYFYPRNYQGIDNLFYYHTFLQLPEYQTGLLLAILFIGFLFMSGRYKEKAIYFVSPCIVMLLLAIAEIFPFLERQTLFLNSIFLLLIFKACDFVDMGKVAKILGFFSFIILCVTLNLWKDYDFSYLSEVLKNKNYFRMSTAREFMPYLEKYYKVGDWVYSTGRDASLRIYDKNNIIAYSLNVEEIEDFDNFINKVQKGSRGHIYISEYPYVGDKYILAYDFIRKNCDIIVEIPESTGTYILFER